MLEQKNPTISVLMSVYREPLEWIKESIDSITGQTFRDLEFIIINDNPEDERLNFFLSAEAAKDSRIRLISNSENIGLTKSLNKGLEQCCGKYIARMDADDISMPTRLERQVEYMEKNSQIVVCGTNIHYFGEVKPNTYSDWLKRNNDDIKAQMLSNSGFVHPSVIIRNIILTTNKIKYDEDYKQGQDYRLWEILSNYGDFANLHEKLLKYRISGNQVSQNSNSIQVDNGRLTRRRIIKAWIDSLGIQNIDIDEIDYHFIKKILLPRIVRKEDLLKYRIFIRTFYFSRSTRKSQYFLRSIISGDILHMSIRDILRYLAILFGRKSLIKW